MPKIAQRYLEVDPWVIVEKGLHADRTLVSESIFSVGNEFMGARGYFEEGYSGKTMQGLYFNGIFFEKPVSNFFKGLVRRTHYIINAIDWLHTRIALDGEQLDLAKCRFSGFRRTLDMRTGVLRREFVWTARKGKQLKLVFERFMSMSDATLGAQRIVFEALNFSGGVRVEAGLNANTACHTHHDRNYFRETRAGKGSGGVLAILAEVEASNQKVMATMRLVSNAPIKPRVTKIDKYIGCSFDLKLERGRQAIVDRIAVCTSERDRRVGIESVWRRGMSLAGQRAKATWESACAAHVAYWTDAWSKLDVTIEGDPENQQGVRFGIFQMHQTYHGADPRNNVAAKGLTGEAYWGVAWWDTETYCLPFYIFNNPRAARNLLLFRHSKLPQAIERAHQKDCEGARYPMCTIDGTEACDTWQHGDLEIHVPAAVSYGIWHYFHVTRDKEFLYKEGIEMLMQISRYYASRGAWSPKTGEYGFWFVMGPDEFHMGVNNNVYTNVMAKKTFEWTLDAMAEMKKETPALLKKVEKKVGLRAGEPADWRLKARKMRVLVDKKTGLFEQHDGYFDAPHMDCSRIPPTDFPLYHHWAYFKIFRWDMTKQPDAQLLHFFFSHEYSLAAKKVNYEYYEPRCSHESSLSPGIHSILAAELGMHKKAYDYWGHAARLDLDDYNRNTKEGLHTTSMAAAWLNVVYGFGGMRSDGPVLSFVPSLPAKWKRFSFCVLHRGSVLQVEIDRKAATFKTIEGDEVPIEVFGRRYVADATGIAVSMPAARIGYLSESCL